MLFRLAADLIGQALFIFVALALYDLLKGVNQSHALSMLILILVAIPIAFLNEVNSVAALVLVMLRVGHKRSKVNAALAVELGCAPIL